MNLEFDCWCDPVLGHALARELFSVSPQLYRSSFDSKLSSAEARATVIMIVPVHNSCETTSHTRRVAHSFLLDVPDSRNKAAMDFNRGHCQCEVIACNCSPIPPSPQPTNMYCVRRPWLLLMRLFTRVVRRHWSEPYPSHASCRKYIL
jgi:hypothetical protein